MSPMTHVQLTSGWVEKSSNTEQASIAQVADEIFALGSLV